MNDTIKSVQLTKPMTMTFEESHVMEVQVELSDGSTVSSILIIDSIDYQISTRNYKVHMRRAFASPE